MSAFCFESNQKNLLELNNKKEFNFNHGQI